MGIYDRDWWRDRYNKRQDFDEQKDATWRKPQQPPKKPETEPERAAPQKARKQKMGLSPSPIGPIIIWTVIFLTIFVSVRHILR
ncbi:hypothetical protein SB751_00045 [Cupriavidus sp. SIMBA_020]|uniref:hypothetical protein n=1 Tax=Cupriavidus sp. SIMBA_020 TaxID=3085766 RepID=UPI00397A0D25